MRKLLAAGIVALAIAGCGTQHVTQAQPTGHASAMASVPGAGAATILARAGVPVNGTFAVRLAFARSMLSASARNALAARLAIPARNRSAFSAELLASAKTELASVRAGKVTTSAAVAAIARFFTADLPAALQRNA